MVWGCFVWGERGPLLILPKGRLNGQSYVTILEETLMDFWMNQSEKRGYIIVQEDNAPIHTCKLANQWRESVDMETLVWPPNSPDLNPIEQVWYHIKTIIQKMTPRPMTVPSLKEAINRAWSEFDVNILNRLVESMPDRIAAVMEAKGGNTKY
jgi:transposase